MLKKFQFHKGTIKTNVNVDRYATYHSFNSIKVRLKLEPVQQLCPCVQEFQFHKGTIKTLPLHRWRVPGAGFQFHKGTIKTDSDFASQVLAHLFQFHKGTIKTNVNVDRYATYHSFNSIKVRLKLV